MQGLILLLLGGLVLRVATTDLHLRYVRPYMQPMLLITAVLLLLTGLRAMIAEIDAATSRERPDVAVFAKAAPPDHDHPAPRSAWLLAVPVVVLLLISPSSLGSFAANRSQTRLAAPTSAFNPLPAPRDGVVPLTLVDFYKRAYYAPETVDGVPVRVRGFVSAEDGSWSVTLLIVSCCAADARPVKVQVVGALQPDLNSWVAVTGTFEKRAGAVVSMTAQQVEPIPTPRTQYVYSS